MERFAWELGARIYTWIFKGNVKVQRNIRCTFLRLNETLYRQIKFQSMYLLVKINLLIFFPVYFDISFDSFQC